MPLPQQGERAGGLRQRSDEAVLELKEDAGAVKLDRIPEECYPNNGIRAQ